MPRTLLRTASAVVLATLVVAGGALAAKPKAHWTKRAPDSLRVERVLASLSTREKIGQILLAYPQVSKEGPVEVGGVLFVGATLKNLKKAMDRIGTSKQRARIAPFFAVDVEGGNFNRLSRHRTLKTLPSARELAQMTDAEVEAWGRKVGRAMLEVGLNMNLAPVFDVAPSGHMFRNGRSFAGDPAVVETKATAYARGMAKAGVIPIAKHFPGYGDVDGDSDHHRVVTDWDQARVEKEAKVFRAAAAWVGGVMMSNIVYSAYGNEPAILNPKLVALAHQQGFITLTDDVAIKALAEQIGATREEVLRRAFLAGNDLILTTEPPDWSGGLDYFGILTELVQKDPKNMQKLDDACRRVLALKDRLGLLDGVKARGNTQ